MVGGRVLGDAHGRQAGVHGGAEGGAVLDEVGRAAAGHTEVALHVAVQGGLRVGIPGGGEGGVPGQVVGPHDGA